MKIILFSYFVDELQVKILRLLRVLGRHDPEASEAMNDILAQACHFTYSHGGQVYVAVICRLLFISSLCSMLRKLSRCQDCSGFISMFLYFRLCLT